MTSLLAAYASSDEEGGTPPPTSRPRLTSPPREPATADEEAKARADAFNLGGLERRSDAGAGGASTSAKEELVGSAAPDVLAEVGRWFLLERVGVGGRRGKVEGGRAGRESRRRGENTNQAELWLGLRSSFGPLSLSRSLPCLFESV